MAPAKCLRHGGPARSTAFRGRVSSVKAASGRGVYQALRIMVALERGAGTATAVSTRAAIPPANGWMVLKRLIGYGLVGKDGRAFALTDAGRAELAEVRTMLCGASA